ncbi:MAG: hypothetical protein EXS14_03770 [Planctomycetes bacterium]|nr:hypothetical protein [Planctomycetota bacterium]
MQRCPKCHADLHESAVRCPLCGTTVRVAALQPGERPAPILDTELALFERDERVVHCASCLRESREDVRRCKPCAQALVRSTRTVLTALLRRRLITELGAAASVALPLLPSLLQRVAEFESPFAAEHALHELTTFGLDGFCGHDGIDPPLPVGRTHLWVRSSDALTARYLLGRVPRGSAAEETARAPEAARWWLSRGKLREVLRLAETQPDNAALALCAATALLRLGRPLEAERRVLAVQPCAQSELEATRRIAAGLFAALAFKRGQGSMDAALSHLQAAALLAPRRVEIAQATVELLDEGHGHSDLREALRRLQTLCPGVLGVGGYYADLAARCAIGK